ncbi:MAG: TIM barrel protein [Candidatus Cyclobacteriaceae bacterium M2_1C_046]
MKRFNRRDFLKSSILAGAGAMLLPSCVSEDRMLTGIQLYTLRDLMQENPETTLEKIQEIGYREVELAGYSDGKFYGRSPGEFKQLLQDAGLVPVSGHYQTGQTFPEVRGTMVNNWEQAVEDAQAIGQEYMVLAYLHDGERKSIDDYYRLTRLINEKAEVCKNAGLQFAYHNHAFELEELDGELPYDVLLTETDPDLVKMELDIYWTVKAGFDPVELFEKDPDRYVLWHVKGMDEQGDFTEVGTGTIDYQRIFNHEDMAGLKHFFIEQDQIKGDKWESVITSYKNVQKFI